MPFGLSWRLRNDVAWDTARSLRRRPSGRCRARRCGCRPYTRDWRLSSSLKLPWRISAVGTIMLLRVCKAVADPILVDEEEELVSAAHRTTGLWGSRPGRQRKIQNCCRQRGQETGLRGSGCASRYWHSWPNCAGTRTQLPWKLRGSALGHNADLAARQHRRTPPSNSP